MSTHFFDNVNWVDVIEPRDETGSIKIRLREELPDGGILYHEVRILPTHGRRFDVHTNRVISMPISLEVGS